MPTPDAHALLEGVAPTSWDLECQKRIVERYRHSVRIEPPGIARDILASDLAMQEHLLDCLMRYQGGRLRGEVVAAG